MNKKINIGIIGSGKITNEYLKILIKLKTFNLEGITSKTNKNSFKIAKRFKINKVYKNYKEMANSKNIDALFVLVSYNNIYKVTKEIIKYRKPIFIEKPPGLSLQETKKLFQLSKKHKVKNMVGLNRRYYSIFEKGKKIISSKGRLLGLSIEGHERAWSKNFRLNNWLFANSIHTLDLINFFGGNVDSKKIYINKYKGLNSNISCNFMFKSGALGLYQAFWYSPGGWSVKLYGEGVTVIFNPLEKGYYFLNDSKKRVILPDKIDLLYKPGFYKQIKVFENYILKNKKDKNMHDLKSCLKTITLLDNINKNINI
ncbi:MAG: hypothetical protein CMA27_01145 [Euryarchaeota archaeon]|nr:hypothetical protein [Euryarchaeota archaeon]